MTGAERLREWMQFALDAAKQDPDGIVRLDRAEYDDLCEAAGIPYEREPMPGDLVLNRPLHVVPHFHPRRGAS